MRPAPAVPSSKTCAAPRPEFPDGHVGLAGFAGVIFDLRGVYFGLGPQGRILESALLGTSNLLFWQMFVALQFFAMWNATNIVPARAADLR